MSATDQTWNARQYADNARFVTDLGMPVVDLLAPKAGERILDLGCGDGIITQRLMDLGCECVGVDASPDMVRAAAALGVDARLMDARALPFEREFDAVFSNAALHWMGPPRKIIESVWNALRPGGRFVGECGGRGNVAVIRSALTSAITERGGDAGTLNPWYFAGDDEYHELLTATGFSISSLALFPRPTPLPGTLVDWLLTFGQPFIAAVSIGDRDAFLEEVQSKCERALRGADGRWTADYVRLRWAAVKPGTAR
jgi:trans-aconitate methyltransferase